MWSRVLSRLVATAMFQFSYSQSALYNAAETHNNYDQTYTQQCTLIMSDSLSLNCLVVGSRWGGVA